MSFPKIGIRPTIDGRRKGVRESLETQTMGMAQIAKDLITKTLKYIDGTPVQVVIADTTVAGAAESAKCAEKFSREGVTATLTVTPCWCYGLETMDTDPHTMKAVWGFNGTERPGAVYLAAAMSAYAQRGLPAFSIYGRDVQDARSISDIKDIPEDVAEKILRFAKAAVAAGTMRGKSYLNIGGVSMGIAGSAVDAGFLQKYLGMRTEWADMSEVLRRVQLGIYDDDEYKIAREWVLKNCPEGLDVNDGSIKLSKKEKEEKWDFAVKMTLVIQDMMTGNEKVQKKGFIEEGLGRNALAAGFQGQRNWTDFLPNADFSESILNSTFNWRGKKCPTVLATENDVLNGLGMLMTFLTEHNAAVFADIRTYWSPDAVRRVTGWSPDGIAANGFMHLINSGAAALDASGGARDKDGNAVMKAWYDMTEHDISAILKKTDWCPANLLYFRGGGYSGHFVTRAEMPVTLVRLNLVDGQGPVLQIAEGHTAYIPEKVSKILEDRTDTTWPTTWFVPRLANGAFKDVYSVMANWGANHGSFCYGHVGADLITLASMLRIPVSMHNVPEKDIFRPHAWASFGTLDPESADYRACKNYGPLYK